jgi:2-polyprenyl-3-methyl-5-hydroxy-6-metoxy-1,4-benzoquinol methylase
VTKLTNLKNIHSRPAPFAQYTAADLWTDEHISAQMLAYHLDGTVDLSSRKTGFIDRSAQWIISHFELDHTKAVADFGCGPGLYTTRLAESGADITGIDFSERSIEYAKNAAQQHNLAINYVCANYLEFETERRFDLITMIMCDYCALSPRQRQIMLTKFHQLLKPGGAVLLDVYSIAAYDARKEGATFARNLMDGFWSANRYYGFLRTFKYEAEKVILDKYTIIEDDRTRVIYNWLQYFDPAALKREFTTVGFEIKSLFGDVAGADYDPDADEYAIVARKPL